MKLKAIASEKLLTCEALGNDIAQSVLKSRDSDTATGSMIVALMIVATHAQNPELFIDDVCAAAKWNLDAGVMHLQGPTDE